MGHLFTHLASWASLLGVGLTSILKDSSLRIIALVFFLACIGVVTWQIYKLIKKNIDLQYPDGFLPISSFIRYTTSDGDHYAYEIYRHIQNKRVFRSAFQHEFQWSGSVTPDVKSSLQDISSIVPMTAENGARGHCVNLKLKKIASFNEAEVIHLKMLIDDSDHKSSPHISQKVSSPIKLISFNIELLHTTGGYYKNKAKFLRRPLDQERAEYNLLNTVEFNTLTKSYEHSLLTPDPGYEYRIEWERPPNRRSRGKKKG